MTRELAGRFYVLTTRCRSRSIPPVRNHCPLTRHHAQLHIELLHRQLLKRDLKARLLRVRIGRYLRVTRIAAGLSQRVLAARAAMMFFSGTVTQQAIQGWETGKRLPQPHHMFNTMNACRLSQKEVIARIIAWTWGQCR